MGQPLFLESTPHFLESRGSELCAFVTLEGNDWARLPRDILERLRSLRIGAGALRSGTAGQTSVSFAVSPLEEEVEKEVAGKDANG